MTETDVDAMTAAIMRAGAHGADPATLRRAQKWQYRVTDLDVARVMRAIESGTPFLLGATGAWRAPAGSPPMGLGHRLNIVVGEMIRTGLVRHVRAGLGGVDHHVLIPARVHVRNPDAPTVSLCLFVGEDLGPMRARLISADQLPYVDCLGCLDVVASGHVRKL